MNKMKDVMKRGALIIFEGCDRSGKTTQCKRQVERLTEKFGLQNNDQPSSIGMRFPDRTTEIGKAINGYLQNTSELDDHVIHLLFTANRWEKVSELKAALERGQHVIVDRYSFSGIAFSSAKDGMSLEWCRQPERGLPKPDLVCFLDVSPEEAAKRGGFGDERYETQTFQAKVRQNYKELIDDSYWKIINTDSKSEDEVFNEISDVIDNVIKKPITTPIQTLWPMTK